MEKKRDTRVIALIALVLAILCTTVAFASLSSTLYIGSPDTNVTVNGKWEIIFTNVTSSTAGLAKVGIAPAVNSLNNTKIDDYTASFQEPGDSLSVNFIVKNNGTIDAKLAEIVMNDEPTCTSLAQTPIVSDATNVCSELTYVLTDSEGVPIMENDTLASGASKTMKLVLTYVVNPSTFDDTNLPKNSVSITNLGLSLKYIQS